MFVYRGFFLIVRSIVVIKFCSPICLLAAARILCFIFVSKHLKKLFDLSWAFLFSSVWERSLDTRTCLAISGTVSLIRAAISK